MSDPFLQTTQKGQLNVAFFVLSDMCDSPGDPVFEAVPYPNLWLLDYGAILR